MSTLADDRIEITESVLSIHIRYRDEDGDITGAMTISRLDLPELLAKLESCRL